MIGDDEKIDAEQRIEAQKFAAQLERAIHNMSYIGPSYLRVQGLLPDPKDSYPSLTMSQIDTYDIEDKDPWEKDRIKTAGEYRRKLQEQQLEQKQPQPQQQQQEEYDELGYCGEEEEEMEEKEDCYGFT